MAWTFSAVWLALSLLLAGLTAWAAGINGWPTLIFAVEAVFAALSGLREVERAIYQERT